MAENTRTTTGSIPLSIRMPQVVYDEIKAEQMRITALAGVDVSLNAVAIKYLRLGINTIPLPSLGVVVDCGVALSVRVPQADYGPIKDEQERFRALLGSEPSLNTLIVRLLEAGIGTAALQAQQAK